jgi:hypothetical protein
VPARRIAANLAKAAGAVASLKRRVAFLATIRCGVRKRRPGGALTNAADLERNSADRTRGGGDSRKEPTAGRQMTNIRREPRNLIVELMPASSHRNRSLYLWRADTLPHLSPQSGR